MRTVVHIIIKPCLAIFIFSIIYFTATAQEPIKHDSLAQVNIKAKFPAKLPNIQEVSVRAPGNIKIDGKTTEWDDNFYARNTFDRISYTVSNDDNKLYLTVQTLGVFGNEKIVKGGVTFIISHSDKRKREKDTGNVSITFPLANRAEASSINAINYNYFNIDKKERETRKKECDSLLNAINELADKIFKEIKIAGIKDVDTLISVYNTTGIKAVAHFDQNMHLVYELAIPLKYLGLTMDSPMKFSYDIKINQAPRIAMPVRNIRVGDVSVMPMPMPANDMSGGMGMVSMGMNRAPDPDMVYRMQTSDFWGEYTLAKK